jgi:hypothetical protein
MRIASHVLALVVVAACGHPQRGGGGGAGGAGGADGPVPEAVRKTVEASLGANARIKAEHEHGVTIYEAVSQAKLELEVTEAGVIQKTEVAIPISTLPTVIVAAANAKGGTIAEAEVVVTPTGAMFEVEVKSAAGEIEYLIDQTGKIVSEEKEEDEKGEANEKGEKDEKDDKE